MTEIELKARVADRASLIARLNRLAAAVGSVTRDDRYWGRPGSPKIRLRRETYPDGAETVVLTYKRKERRADAPGPAIEVNDERECTVSDAAPLETFLTDAGFEVMLAKHKEVMGWTLPLPAQSGAEPLAATFELCAVPPLGDFLEIEILSPADDPETVAGLRRTLQGLLAQAGLDDASIEPRYYSELLAAGRQHAAPGERQECSI